jgi:hypothetical protein
VSERDKSPSSSPAAPRGYKRSWKNLLINKRYQLRFTLFMVGLSAVLMAALGYFVMRYTDQTTTIGINRVISEPCPEVPKVARAEAPAAPAEDLDPDTGRPKPKVTLDEQMTDAEGNPIEVAPPPPPAPPPPLVPPGYADQVALNWGCQLRHAGAVANLHAGRLQILLVLIGAGLLLVFGLAVYGIKMTHKVAGPLYKVSLYFAKMRDGRYDKVWNLRKGDQLVEFYDHFKHAHAGVVAMEHADIERLRAMIAAIDKDPDKWAAPELAAKVTELRDMLARKEKSVE